MSSEKMVEMLKVVALDYICCFVFVFVFVFFYEF
jgi:hypothetical protein